MFKITTKQEGMFAVVAIVAIVVASFVNTLYGVLIAVTALTWFAINEFKKEMKDMGLGAANEAREKTKARNRQKLMEYLVSHGTVTNDEVQELLNVSHATATRYLDEFQEEKLIKEMGKGRGTSYEAL